MRTWPFPQAPGYKLPASSRLTEDPSDPAEWGVGSGVAEAFFTWSEVTAYAAYIAHQRGDDSTAASSLRWIADAYSDAYVQAVIDDPDGLYVTHVIDPALHQRDFGPLVAFYGFDQPFRSAPALADIARAAGDL